MRIITVSNRLPLSVSIQNGQVRYRESAGGLVSGLSAYLDYLKKSSLLQTQCLWLGWPGSNIPENLQPSVQQTLHSEYQAAPVFLTEKEMDNFYGGFCNKTIWPLFHYFPSYTRYAPEYWESYEKVNQLFAETILQQLEPDDTVWIHDYHLMRLPLLLRNRRPDATIGFFLHIPFPSFELFRLLPKQWRQELLEGLLGADLIGFHTHDYVQHFLKSVLRILGHDHKMGKIFYSGRIVHIDTFPMGIDFKKFHDSGDQPQVIKERKLLQDQLKVKKVILSIDRLDYTKGIVNRLLGFEQFLSNHSEWQSKIVFILILVPSRTMVDQYQQMKKQIDELVGKINGRFSSLNWTPIHYHYRFLPFHPLAALYGCSDIALLTPLRDGMNLVCKEYLATRKDQQGVLILSEMAGAAKELGEALIINPNNLDEIEKAILDAAEMSPEEQIERNEKMQKRLRRYDVIRWASDFLQQLAAIKNEQNKWQTRYLSTSLRGRILDHFNSAATRSIFLDYDGTLVPFHPNPQLASPSSSILHCLDKMCSNPRNQVVIVSGRDKNTLQRWFHSLPDLNLVAEHGVWIKKKSADWELLRTMNNEWKTRIQPLLELYADRLPGAFVEEKDFSLVWHYRAADPELGSIRAQELMDDLSVYTANIELQVLQGNKVIEIRNAGINKGGAAQRWLESRHSEFIIAIGDDLTDEELFEAMPETAYTIKVGLAMTKARYFLYQSTDVVAFMQQFCE